jgi:hypothetical protein
LAVVAAQHAGEAPVLSGHLGHEFAAHPCADAASVRGVGHPDRPFVVQTDAVRHDVVELGPHPLVGQ